MVQNGLVMTKYIKKLKSINCIILTSVVLEIKKSLKKPKITFKWIDWLKYLANSGITKAGCKIAKKSDWDNCQTVRSYTVRCLSQ